MPAPVPAALHPAAPVQPPAGGVVASAGALLEDEADAPLDDEAGAPGPPMARGGLGIDLSLHPAVWRASQVGGGARPVTSTGFDRLDAQLPGGGWPHGVLTELLLPQPGIGELRLLAPGLMAVAGGGEGRPGAAADPERCVMLFDPPAALSAWALLQCGLSSRHWLVVQARSGQGRGGPAAGPLPMAWRPETAPGVPRGANRLAPLLPAADLLWALEQSLKSGHVGAVLAWLPVNLRADALRRLQLAAQSHAGPVFLFRDALARARPSAAPLRLLLQPAGVDGLAVRVLKRRGPLLAQPLRLVLPPVLAPQQQAQAEARQLARDLARNSARNSARDSAHDARRDPAGDLVHQTGGGEAGVSSARRTR
ncbi:MAG: hypothetical protein Q7U26_18375 [Aquabacterium sp.]|nr:hypothetical protein [Aquabacterium sp.]